MERARKRRSIAVFAYHGRRPLRWSLAASTRERYLSEVNAIVGDINRRAFLATGGLALGRAVSSAQQPATAASYARQYPDMLFAYIAGKHNALSERWDREREAIRDRAALERRNSFVRARSVEMLHGYPEKTPLRPVVVKTSKRDGYRVENVMFESRPGFFVTGNLYLPDSGKGPFPAIISPCGHYPLARMQAGLSIRLPEPG